MNEVFFAGQLQRSFPSEREAMAFIRETVEGRDKQRPAEKRFELQALECATPLQLKNGATLLRVADMAFILAANRSGEISLFGSGEGMSFLNLADANEWVAEFSDIAPGAWAVFEAVSPE